MATNIRKQLIEHSINLEETESNTMNISQNYLEKLQTRHNRSMISKNNE